jgi:uncharacterized protein YndB with AHSA1/START domain
VREKTSLPFRGGRKDWLRQAVESEAGFKGRVEEQGRFRRASFDEGVDPRKRKEDRTALQITVEGTVSPPVEEVWRAWTTPEDIKQWNAASDECTFGGRTLFVHFIKAGDRVTVRETFDAEETHTPEQRAGDLRGGGAWPLVIHGPDGTDYHNVSGLVEVGPTERVVYDHLEPIHCFRMTMTYAHEGEGTR